MAVQDVVAPLTRQRWVRLARRRVTRLLTEMRLISLHGGPTQRVSDLTNLIELRQRGAPFLASVCKRIVFATCAYMRGSKDAAVAAAHRLRLSPLASADAKWIELKGIHWKDEEGKPRMWEMVQRTKRGTTGVDAVAIFPRLIAKGMPDRTILVKVARAALVVLVSHCHANVPCSNIGHR